MELKTNPGTALLEAALLLDNYCRVIEFPAGYARNRPK
jgi:hypothetical protein